LKKFGIYIQAANRHIVSYPKDFVVLQKPFKDGLTNQSLSGMMSFPALPLL